jgi:hypothetical protein
VKPYYPAICRSGDGTYFLTNELYSSDAEARAILGAKLFVRLAEDYKPILLPEEKPQAVNYPKIKIGRKLM